MATQKRTEYRRLTATNEELVAAYKRLGSMTAVAIELNVGYQAVTERFKRLRAAGLRMTTPGKPPVLNSETLSKLQQQMDA